MSQPNTTTASSPVSAPIKGRGSSSNMANRFSLQTSEYFQNESYFQSSTQNKRSQRAGVKNTHVKSNHHQAVNSENLIQSVPADQQTDLLSGLPDIYSAETVSTDTVSADTVIEDSLSSDIASDLTVNPKTVYIKETCKSIINYNQSPDIPFDRSVNIYRGCEHGCIYCFARPTHSYLDLSPGLDFETKIIYKHNAIEQLKKELESPRYQCKPIALGINTDAYQPIDEQLKLTRQALQVCLEYKQPVSLLTKSKLVLRDLDILQDLSKENLVSVGVSLTSLNNRLKTIMEPRTASAKARLNVMKQLTDNGIATTAMIAPIIPAINDKEIERLLDAVHQQGVEQAGYVLLRLPYELKTLFSDWLEQHFPYRKQKVLNYLYDMRNGQLNNSEFGTRMTGSGIFANLFKIRFQVACRKFQINMSKPQPLNCDLFKNHQPAQLALL
ncbi:PA0069 family radical SAM protein [Pleionea mediterranea]|uniref:DNA repair photolyase n=1 Tax=Pleionea mediterranea TaxID=523701 RepID=A0A316F9M4_9GAMM|nr:PA0069 family radical SAM protein [Pleionea mediterranea]PWK42184.1 DNA repair photolyase [Pleionea mediterranea]